MRIYLTSIFVDDQAKAKRFYTEVLGFQIKHDMPVGDHSWLTVVSPEAPDGPELLLEPSVHRAVPPYKQALFEDGIPAASFAVHDLVAEHRRLSDAGVVFTQEPTPMGPVSVAIFNDTCGNLIQLTSSTDK